jgi:hypothetical protein
LSLSVLLVVTAFLMIGPPLAWGEERERPSQANQFAGARVSTPAEATLKAQRAYIDFLTTGEISLSPEGPIYVAGGVTGFTNEDDRLWEIRFVFPEGQVRSRLLINAETGQWKIVCTSHSKQYPKCQ